MLRRTRAWYSQERLSFRFFIREISVIRGYMPGPREGRFLSFLCFLLFPCSLRSKQFLFFV